MLSFLCTKHRYTSSADDFLDARGAVVSLFRIKQIKSEYRSAAFREKERERECKRVGEKEIQSAREGENTPKCNIILVRRRTFRSESKIEFTSIEIRNALKNLISAAKCLFFMARSRYIKNKKQKKNKRDCEKEKREERSNCFEERENAVNFSTIFLHTNSYHLAI